MFSLARLKQLELDRWSPAAVSAWKHLSRYSSSFSSQSNSCLIVFICTKQRAHNISIDATALYQLPKSRREEGRCMFIRQVVPNDFPKQHTNQNIWFCLFVLKWTNVPPISGGPAEVMSCPCNRAVLQEKKKLVWWDYWGTYLTPRF